MATLVVLDTATLEVRRYVGGGAAPVLTHSGRLTGSGDFAAALERFRASPPTALRICQPDDAGLPPYVA